MPRRESNIGASSAQAQQNAASEGIGNFELPRSLINRIGRSGIPENVRFQKEAALAIVKGSTVFINYIAATAHEVASSKQHKSISASDVLKALELLEFGDMVGLLQTELQVYRELHKSDKNKKVGGSSRSGAEAPATLARMKSKPQPQIVPKISIPARMPQPTSQQVASSEGPEPELGMDDSDVPMIDQAEEEFEDEEGDADLEDGDLEPEQEDEELEEDGVEDIAGEGLEARDSESDDDDMPLAR